MDDNRKKPNDTLFKEFFLKLQDEETKNVHNQLHDDKDMAKIIAKLCLDYAANDIKQNH